MIQGIENEEYKKRLFECYKEHENEDEELLQSKEEEIEPEQENFYFHEI
jgi:hypothetical protein